MAFHLFKDAENYSKNNNLQNQFINEFLASVELDFLKNASVLDIGSGDGKIAADLASKASRVVGIDLSQPMIDYATKRYQDYKNLGFQQMDATCMNFPKESFNAIVSFNTLHWIQDQKAVLEGINTVAAPNAKILLLFSHKKSIYHTALEKTCQMPEWEGYFKSYENPRCFFTKEAYQSLLLDAGFISSFVEEKEMTYVFHSNEELKSFLYPSMSQVQKIPLKDQDAFLESFCQQFYKLSSCKDLKEIPLSFWCLEVVGEKMTLDKSYELDRPKLKM